MNNKVSIHVLIQLKKQNTTDTHMPVFRHSSTLLLDCIGYSEFTCNTLAFKMQYVCL